jgi:hypothetical protein
MSRTWQQVVELVQRGEIRVSAHGYDELAADGILVRDVISGISSSVVIEDYPDYHKSPTVLVLQWDTEGNPIHLVWGIAKGASSPAVLVTGYRPAPERWSEDFTRRKT